MIWMACEWNFVRFAILATVDLGQLYSVAGMTSAGYLRRFFSGLGWGRIPLLLLLVLFVRGLLIEKRGRLVRLFPITIILGYLIIASISQNRDLRFSVPALIALPLCLSFTT